MCYMAFWLRCVGSAAEECLLAAMQPSSEHSLLVVLGGNACVRHFVGSLRMDGTARHPACLQCDGGGGGGGREGGVKPTCQQGHLAALLQSLEEWL